MLIEDRVTYIEIPTPHTRDSCSAFYKSESIRCENNGGHSRVHAHEKAEPGRKPSIRLQHDTIGGSDVLVGAICTHLLYPVKMYSLSCCHAGISCHVSVTFLFARRELGLISGARSGLSSGPAKTRVSANSSNAGTMLRSSFNIVCVVGLEYNMASILPHPATVGGTGLRVIVVPPHDLSISTRCSRRAPRPRAPRTNHMPSVYAAATESAELVSMQHASV